MGCCNSKEKTKNNEVVSTEKSPLISKQESAKEISKSPSNESNSSLDISKSIITRDSSLLVISKKDPKLKILKQRLKTQLVSQLNGRNSEKEEDEIEEEQNTAIPIISRPKEISKTVYEELSTALTNIMDISSKTILLLTGKVEEGVEKTQALDLLCNELTVNSKRLGDTASRATLDLTGTLNKKDKKREALNSGVSNLSKDVSQFVTAAQNREVSKLDKLLTKINKTSAKILKASSILIHQSICAKELKNSASSINKKIQEFKESVVSTHWSDQLMKSCKIANEVLSKLGDSIGKSTEFAFFIKAISVCSFQLEDSAYVVAGQLKYGSSMQDECLTMAKHVRGASVLLQVVANQMSRVDSENKKEEEGNQTRDQTLLLLLSSAASSFCQSVNSLIDLTTEIHRVMVMSASKTKGETPSSKPTQEKENIWKEKREVSLIFTASEQNTSEKKVKAASLNTIILLLILPNEDRNLNVEKFQRIFLYTYPTFCTPELLFKKLAEIYDLPPKSVKNSKMILERVATFMKEWIDFSFHEFDERILLKIQKFANSKLSKVDNKVAQEIIEIINSKQRRQSTNIERPPSIDPKLLEETLPSQFILDESPEIIANMLTFIESKLFYRIKPREFLFQSWIKYKQQAPNVLRMINRFNNVSLWVASSILWQYDHSLMCSAFSKFISISEFLLQSNNFNSLFAVLAGLQMAPIWRLNIIDKIPATQKESFNKLVSLMNPKSSFGNYRKAIQSAQGPKIPYLGIYLTDLVFIDEGNQDFAEEPKVKQKLINFRKRELLYSVIKQLEDFQREVYPNRPGSKITVAQDFLESVPHLQQEELWQLSLVIQPRT